MNGKTAYLLLLLLICYLLPSAALAADIYHGVKSDIENGRTEIALSTLQSFIEQKPGDYQAWFLIGVAHARKQQFHQAIEAFRRVIEINSDLAEPHNNLAVIYNELGDVRAAVNELELSLKKRPDYAIVEENIGDLYVKLALKNYRNSLDKDPRENLKKRYIRLLKVRNPTTRHGHTPAFSENVTEVVIPASKQTVAVEAVAPVKRPEPVSVAVVKVEAPSVEDSGLKAEKSLKEEILEAVEAWRTAWSKRDLSGYLVAYSKDFRVPKGFDSLERWQKYKRQVIGSKTYIQVELSDIRIELENGNMKANIKFLQKFSSNSYNSDDLKVLQMRLENGTWKIVSEVSVS
ncbi:MAG: tetratricopeptide repeat protein [Mariprofundaceae bacterium]